MARREMGEAGVGVRATGAEVQCPRYSPMERQLWDSLHPLRALAPRLPVR